MAGRRVWLRAAMLGALMVASGCVAPEPPPLEPIATPEPVCEVCPYLEADRLGRRVYERIELPEERDAAPVRYVRRQERERMSEGALARRTFLPLDRYLRAEAAPASTTQPAASEVPRAPVGGGTALFFEVDQPLAPLPMDLQPGTPIVSETPIRYYNYEGRLAARGTLRREARIEGFEDVECPAGRFEHCLRVRVDLQVRFPWVALVELTGHLWLSPEVGEVRRIQRLSGWFLIFWFGSVFEYQLLSSDAAPLPQGGLRVPEARWHRGAVLLRGHYPGLRVAGMVVDFATDTPGP